MKELTTNELKEISGGGLIDDLMGFAYVSGYIAGSALDLAHGLWDGLMGVDPH